MRTPLPLSFQPFVETITAFIKHSALIILLSRLRIYKLKLKNKNALNDIPFIKINNIIKFIGATTSPANDVLFASKMII